MKITLLLFVFAPLLAAQTAEPKAFLRYRAASSSTTAAYYIAVFPDPALDHKFHLSSIEIALYGGSSKLIPAHVARGGDPATAPLNVEIKAQDQASLLDSFDDLSLVISTYPTQSGIASSHMSVSLELSVAFDNNPNCNSGLMLTVGTSPKKPALSNAYTRSRSHAVMDFIAATNPYPATFQKAGEDTVGSTAVALGKEADDGSRLFRCLTFVPRLGPGKYRFQMAFSGKHPIELSSSIRGETEIDVTGAVPSGIDKGDIGDRSLERNLDLGIQFTSAVKDSGDPPPRQRTNQGTFDVRLAPLLNLLPNPIANDTTFLFYTPIFIDARISTGQVTEDNLSMNRINIGSDFEFRKYPVNAGNSPNFYRVILGSRNSSDRDFHQAEFKGVAELLPVFGALNHPLSVLKPMRMPWKIKLDPTEKDKNQIEPRARFGWQVLPVFGVEFGRIYRNRFRAATVINDETVRRFYLGGSISLDITKYFSISAEDRLYVRGEAKDDRLHNYFKTSMQFGLPALTSHAAHGVFFNFERGNQPPFATPDVNALKLGYRIQWDNWFDKWR